METTGIWETWQHDTRLRLLSDGRAGALHPAGVWRTGRIRFKRYWLEQGRLQQTRFFCLNSGGCGSTYLIRLLADNFWNGVYHEKTPDFNEIGVLHYENPLNVHRLASLLRYTRWDVFLEASNRLFSLAIPLHKAFPGARFIHLHRDGRQAVCSTLSRPDVEGYLAGNVRFQGFACRDLRPAAAIGQQPVSGQHGP